MEYVPLVEYCVKKLVEDPEQVEVEEVRETGAIQVLVRVAPDDAGKVIGRNGRLIGSLRQIVSAAASKGQEKVYVKVVTEEAGD